MKMALRWIKTPPGPPKAGLDWISEVGVKIVCACRSRVRNLPRGQACGCLLGLYVFGILDVIRKLDAVEGLGGSGGEHSKSRAIGPSG